MSFVPSSRLVTLLRVASFVVLVVAPLAAGPADARAGGGFSFGSRGSRSYSAPAPTATAPRYASPFQQSDAQRMRPGMAQPRRFGFGSGLLAGLLGAGLFGMFSGAGFFGGIASLFGLLFKLALVGGVIWLVLRLFRGRSGPVMAGGPASFSGGPAAGLGASATGASQPATLQPADYQQFEQTLLRVQEAFSREDLAGLARVMTPEMVRGLAADLDRNRARGLRNDVSGAKLLQGDLSEAWREGAVTYATVAMRFAAVDVMVDRTSGRIMSGDPVHPVEATELWTFRRDGFGAWILSGLQQGA